MQVIVLYIIIIFLFGLFKKVNLYESFSIGVEDSYRSLLKMFPSMLGIVLVLNVFLNSGIVEKMHLCGVEKFFCPELNHPNANKTDFMVIITPYNDFNI